MRIYTEIRIAHKTLEEKKAFEDRIDAIMKEYGSKTRVAFIKEAIEYMEFANSTKGGYFNG